MICPNCGAPNQDGAQICTQCHAALASAPPIDVVAPPPMAQVMTSPTPPKTSGMAIASLVTGLCGLFTCGMSSLVGILLGIIALVQIGQSKGKLTGRGLAIGGLCASCCIFVLILVLNAIFLPVFNKAREKVRMVSCTKNQREIALAIQMYALEHEEKLPADWGGISQGFALTQSNTNLICRSAPIDPSRSNTYGYNSTITGKGLGLIPNPSATLATADSDSADNYIHSDANIALLRHRDGYIASYVDGHTAFVPVSRQ